MRDRAYTLRLCECQKRSGLARDASGQSLLSQKPQVFRQPLRCSLTLHLNFYHKKFLSFYYECFRHTVDVELKGKEGYKFERFIHGLCK